MKRQTNISELIVVCAATRAYLSKAKGFSVLPPCKSPSANPRKRKPKSTRQNCVANINTLASLVWNGLVEAEQYGPRSHLQGTPRSW